MSVRVLTPLLACAACIVSIAVIVLGTGSAGSAAAMPATLGPPTATDSFQLARLDGTSLDSLDLRGRVLVVDVWATWCGPCLVEIPGLNALYADYRASGIEVIGVTVDSGSGEEILALAARHFPVDYTLTLGNDRFEETFGPLWALPQTFLLDQQGRVRRAWMGALPGKQTQLRDLIDQLLVSTTSPDQLASDDR